MITSGHDDNGKSEHIKWHTTGFKRQHCYFVDNDLDGLYKEWHENGGMRTECVYAANKIEGLYREWYDSGVIRAECFYVNSKLNGLYKEWHKCSALRIKCFYKDNQYHGEYRQWFPDGKDCSHYFHSDGVEITNEIKSLVSDIKHITTEERVLIKLRFGIECLC